MLFEIRDTALSDGGIPILQCLKFRIPLGAFAVSLFFMIRNQDTFYDVGSIPNSNHPKLGILLMAPAVSPTVFRCIITATRKEPVKFCEILS